MTLRKPPEKRQYQQSGLYALQGALKKIEASDWTEELGVVGEALRAWRGDLIEALGGEDTISPQQRSLIEMATRTHLMLESVDRFILAMPSLVNKSKRSIFAVVKERGTLADSLARYLGQLGLEARKPRTVSASERMAQHDRRTATAATPTAKADQREIGDDESNTTD